MLPILDGLLTIATLWVLSDELYLIGIYILYYLSINYLRKASLIYRQLIISVCLITIAILFLSGDPGFIFMAVGVILNSIVSLANDNTMPVCAIKYVKVCGDSRLDPDYSFIGPNTRYKFLSDILYFPYAGGIFSIGDIIIGLGHIILIINH